MPGYIQVQTTTEKKEDAERIARVLAEKRLAACVQVLGPMRSTYWWQGRIDSAEEYLCLIKTRKALYKKVEKAIRENHPYAVPEIIGVPILKGSRDYLGWIKKETQEGR